MRRIDYTIRPRLDRGPMVRFSSAFGVGLALMLAFSTFAQANGVELANSITEFSLTQGQGGWSYGIYNQTTHGVTYHPDNFALFDLPDSANNSWKASSALVPSPDPEGRHNTLFLNTNDVGGHPTGIDIDGQDRIVWAMRRYTSEISGIVAINFDVRKLNTTNPDGGGITARIFVEGNPVLTQFIANADGVGVQGTVIAAVDVGSRIDFAIDPLGVRSPRDGVYSPRADGSHFSAKILQIPEPTTAGLLGIGGVVLLRCAVSRRRSGLSKYPQA